MNEKGPLEKSLMKVAADLGISFSAAKICYDKGYREALENNPILEAAGKVNKKLAKNILEHWYALSVIHDGFDSVNEGNLVTQFRAILESLPEPEKERK